MKDIQQRVIDLINKRTYTVEELGQKTGLTRQTIYNFTSGKSCTLTTMNKIIQFLEKQGLL